MFLADPLSCGEPLLKRRSGTATADQLSQLILFIYLVLLRLPHPAIERGL